MKRSILGVCLALFAASSFASGIGNSYGGEGGKGGAATATGGNATGGNATGGAGYGGAGGSVLGSGNSSNANTNMQGQAQGQAQGQIATGGQGGSAVSGSTSGASSFSGGNTQTNLGNNSRNDSSASNATNVTVQGDSYESHRAPVSTAYAPMISPTAVCALGLSGGAQGVGFGVSFGSSYIDENCQKLEQIRTVSTVLGDRATAAEMMCSVPAYKEARERTGKPCGGAAKVSAASAAQSVSASKSDYEAKKKAAGYQGDDPVVLGRLGIAPLK